MEHVVAFGNDLYFLNCVRKLTSTVTAMVTSNIITIRDASADATCKTALQQEAPNLFEGHNETFNPFYLPTLRPFWGIGTTFPPYSLSHFRRSRLTLYLCTSPQKNGSIAKNVMTTGRMKTKSTITAISFTSVPKSSGRRNILPPAITLAP